MKRHLADAFSPRPTGAQSYTGQPAQASTAEIPGYYLGQKVRYWSISHKQWVYCTVSSVADDGGMIISCKPQGPPIEKNDDRLQHWDRGPEDCPLHDDPPAGYEIQRLISNRSEVEFAGKWRFVTRYEIGEKTRVRWRLGDTDWAWLGENPPSIREGDVNDLIKKN